MNKLSKTLLLLGMQAQCRADRDKDWQSLHKRDREWYLAQPPQGRWQLARRWVRRFAGPQPWILAISPQIAALVGIVLGVGLMSGLLQFQPQQRINLWWWLLLAVWLPVLWWLLGLWLGRYAAHGVWAQGLFSRLPPHWQLDETPLLGLTARTLSQRFSLGFALGMVAAVFLYLLLTDLAFGWSSTLSVSATGVHKLTQILSLPWRGIWPQAVPSLELIEGTRYFRVEEVASTGGEQLGQWWRFLLMNLLTYVLVPRILSLAWAEWQLGRAQRRLFAQDACIDGWWQRLHAEQVRQRAGPAPSNRSPSPGAHPDTARQADGTGADTYLPVLQGMVVAGDWPARELASLIAQLPDVLRALPQLTTDEASALTSPSQAFLLLCKGWEPPTGSLADLCQQLHEQGHKTYLWPAPLPHMNPERVRRLRESWQLFIAQLPSSCHLLEPKPDA